MSGDDFGLEAYAPDERGGPLHLLNVTVNETIDGTSQIEQRDRKGLAMAVGPCGLSVGVRDHALWTPDERGASIQPLVPAAPAREPAVFPATAGVRPVEALSVGTWTAISGAAFSTGLGARTSLGLSLLLGLANVRLGYWWHCGVDPRGRPGFAKKSLFVRVGELLSRLAPVQAFLLDELLARFHGTARARWYLSDGGHFENTGAYELLRRRLPFVVVLDDGQDDDYTFADLANLVRKARTDFGAEIVLFTEEEISRYVSPELAPCFGTPASFRAEPFRQPHALLARVYYDDRACARPPGSVILFLKPSLSGDEPHDVREYKSSRPHFPQEPTIDQFFDEAQWESYRRLGEHIALKLFAAPADGGWSPARMRAVEVAAPDGPPRA
jgi:hypothetical protein